MAALHRASIREQPLITKLVHQNGANASFRENARKTAKELARITATSQLHRSCETMKLITVRMTSTGSLPNPVNMQDEKVLKLYLAT